MIGRLGLRGAGKGARLGLAGQIFGLPSVGHRDRLAVPHAQSQGLGEEEKSQIGASHG